MKKLLLLFSVLLFSTTSYSQNESYKKLKRSLYAFSEDPHFTVFRNMDYNFAGPNIQGYLQQNMNLSITEDYTMSETQIVENYILKASKENEYLRIKYNVLYTEDVVGYYPSDYVLLIKDVEITGSYDLITKLFLNYWPGNLKIEEYKDGLIATKEVLGDFITISGYSGNVKINIVKGNVDVDYTKTYGVNEEKK